MELIKKQVHYTQEGKRTFDQFYLDEDYNVPDAKEDVQQIIQGNGTVKIEDIKLVENYIRDQGGDYSARYEGKNWPAFTDRCKQQKAGNPPWAG